MERLTMRLIDAHAIPWRLSDELELYVTKEAIIDLPTVDAAPVVHGRWDDSGRYTFPGGSTAVRCTECGCALTVSEYRLHTWYYCPVCGAKMDGGGDT